MDEVLCDFPHLEFGDVLLGNPYLRKSHAGYESRPRSVIITFENKFYRIPEVAMLATISLIVVK